MKQRYSQVKVNKEKVDTFLELGYIIEDEENGLVVMTKEMRDSVIVQLIEDGKIHTTYRRKT